MNKELIDLAWSILPKEYREEVKKLYDRFLFTREGYYDELFGKHNLTSDAEGEEVLTVSAITVREMYAANERIKTDAPDKELGRTSGHINHVLRCLFGSKCLPDEKSTTQFKIGDKVRAKGTKQIGTIKEPYSNDIGYRVYFEDGDGGWDKEYPEDELIPYKEPKPAEPKFKVDDKVECLHNHHIYVIRHLDFYDGIWRYNYGNPAIWIKESDLEPYTEPEKEESKRLQAESVETLRIASEESHLRNLSQNIADCDKQFDNILKDSFRNERRLNIATQMIKAIMQCPEAVGRIASAEADSLLDDILHDALYLTDRLMSECEEGGFK